MAKKKSKNIRTEEHVQSAICEYLSKRYPGVYYKSDLSGENMPGYVAQRKQKMTTGRGFPDLSIYATNGLFGLLAIEIKIETEIIAKLDKSTQSAMWANEHVKEQAEWIEHLNCCGHQATFCIGADHGIRIIDAFMTNKMDLLLDLCIVTPYKAYLFQKENQDSIWHQIQKQRRRAR